MTTTTDVVVSGIVAVLVLLIREFFKATKGNCRSECCGNEIDLGDAASPRPERKVSMVRRMMSPRRAIRTVHGRQPTTSEQPNEMTVQPPPDLERQQVGRSFEDGRGIPEIPL